MNYILKKLSKRKITKYLGVSMKFVISWTRQSNQDPTPDQRGWKKDRPRKYTANQEEKILSIYYNLKDDLSSFFYGPSAIFNL